jgi:murein DD-endopeptidase MepM/ murein hydrolase activator NlpD
MRLLPRSAALVATLCITALASGDRLSVVPLPPIPPMRALDPAMRAADPNQTLLAIAALDRKIADLDAEEAADKRELAGLGARVAEAHERVLVRGRGFYRMTRAGMLAIGGGFDALVTHAMHFERARRSLEAELGAERALRDHGADLARELERVARDRVAMGSQRTAMDAARVAMRDEERRRSAFDRAFQTSAATSDYVSVYGGASADPSSGAAFASSKGRLLFPVVGKSDVRAARREGTDGPGLEVRAPMGAVVRAVFGGKVAFADRYGAYGRIVILDHGDHYYSVSGNLSEVDVRLGDDITAGERIGTVGDDGQGPMLYFEIRHGAETLVPGPWLGM